MAATSPSSRQQSKVVEGSVEWERSLFNVGDGGAAAATAASTAGRTTPAANHNHHQNAAGASVPSTPVSQDRIVLSVGDREVSATDAFSASASGSALHAQVPPLGLEMSPQSPPSSGPAGGHTTGTASATPHASASPNHQQQQQQQGDLDMAAKIAQFDHEGHCEHVMSEAGTEHDIDDLDLPDDREDWGDDRPGAGAGEAAGGPQSVRRGDDDEDSSSGQDTGRGTNDDETDAGSTLTAPSTMRPRYARSAFTQSEACHSEFGEHKTVRNLVNEFLNSGYVVLFFMGLIILSTLAFMLETVPELSADPEYGNPSHGCFWFSLETTFIAFFTLEYVGRWVTDDQPMVFPVEFFNIIDLVAILPYYVELMIVGPDRFNPCVASQVRITGSGEEAEQESLVDLRFVRVIRLARVFRALKLGKNASSTTVLIDTFQNSKAALMVPFFFLFLGVVLWSSLMYIVEQGTYEDGEYYITDSQGHRQTAVFISIPDALWWAIVTITTVGYGDMSPRSHAGKAINSFCMIFGVLFFAMPISIVGNEFTKAWEAKLKKDEDDARVKQQHRSEGEIADLAQQTKNWGERELRHFRLYFSEYNYTEAEFMGLGKEEQPMWSQVKPAEKLIPEHFNWRLFSAKAKKIATQLSTSDFFLHSPTLPDLDGEYLRTKRTQVSWVHRSGHARLLSVDGYWTVLNPNKPYPRLRSHDKHGGSLPTLKTNWVVETEPGVTTRCPTTKLAAERSEICVEKSPGKPLEGFKFEERETGLWLVASDDQEGKAFVGRRVIGYNTEEEFQIDTEEMDTLTLKFAPKIVPDASLLNLAYKVFHIFRVQGSPLRPNAKASEKNPQMYTKDFIAQLYHHIGFGRLPTGFRSKAGLKFTCGSDTDPKVQFQFSSDSDLGVFGLGPGSVSPVYCIANQAKVIDERENQGSIGGELLVLAQNYYISTDRKRTQRVYLITYRGTYVRFYSAYFSLEYLHAASTGQQLDDFVVEISSYPNRPDSEGLPLYPDTVRERDTTVEQVYSFPYTGHRLDLDADDNPLRLISVDKFMTRTLKPGMRVHGVNNVGVKNVAELEEMLELCARDERAVNLSVSQEYDALDFLNPAERRSILSLLQKLRMRVIKYLKEDLDDKLAFAPMASPRVYDRGMPRLSSSGLSPVGSASPQPPFSPGHRSGPRPTGLDASALTAIGQVSEANRASGMSMVSIPASENGSFGGRYPGSGAGTPMAGGSRGPKNVSFGARSDVDASVGRSSRSGSPGGAAAETVTCVVGGKGPSYLGASRSVISRRVVDKKLRRVSETESPSSSTSPAANRPLKSALSRGRLSH